MGAAADSAVGALVVVEVLEACQLVIESLRVPWGGLGAQPAFQCLVEPFDFALGLWVAG